MDDLIWTKQNSLTKEFCEHCIERFENDETKKPGQVGTRRVDETVKRSTDLMVHSAIPGWETEVKVFWDALDEGVKEYMEYIRNINPHFEPSYEMGEVTDSGYQIQRTLPGEFYIWHNDYAIKEEGLRFLTYLWYLNDVHEDGYTEFYNGLKIQPEQGKLLVFPALWSYVHRGFPPKTETKYVATGWLYYNCYPFMMKNGFIRRWR